MFKLNEKIELNRNFLEFDYNRYPPSEKSTTNTANSETYINKPREHSVISLLNSYIDLSFDVLHAASNDRYVYNDDIRLVDLGSITFL